MPGKVYVVGTFDTKHEELVYLRDLIVARGLDTCVVDLSTQGKGKVADVTPEEVAAYHPDGANAVLGGTDRGTAVTAMSLAFENFIVTRNDLVGIIGAGGSGNTALVTKGLRALPVGVPKVMVSTVGSGDTTPYVGSSDICIMNSVADVAGLNRITRPVLGNAANAVAGMAANPIAATSDRSTLGITMFGVTTTAVTQVREGLEPENDCLVFHATGAGGRAMEKLISSGLIEGCFDLTTTEIADYIVGGIMAADETRLDCVAEAEIPYVGSCGALDMVNFGGKETVPEKFRDRNLFVHNAQVTLMRTTRNENTDIGRWIGEKLNNCNGPVRFLLPLGGISQIDAPGMPFHDPVADSALFAALNETVEQNDNRKLIRVEANINDPEFSEAVLAAWAEIAG